MYLADYIGILLICFKITNFTVTFLNFLRICQTDTPSLLHKKHITSCTTPMSVAVNRKRHRCHMNFNKLHEVNVIWFIAFVSWMRCFCLKCADTTIWTQFSGWKSLSGSWAWGWPWKGLALSNFAIVYRGNHWQVSALYLSQLSSRRMCKGYWLTMGPMSWHEQNIDFSYSSYIFLYLTVQFRASTTFICVQSLLEYFYSSLIYLYFCRWAGT